jgi:NADH-quinone oxidoreductase subunit N
LLGLPPLAGFAGKFQVFVAVYDAAKAATAAGHASLGSSFYILLGIGLLNTAVSAYYYLRVVRVMLLEEPTSETTSSATAPGAAFYLTLLAAALFAAGIVWNPLVRAAEAASSSFAL